MPAPAPPEIRAKAIQLVQEVGVREAAKQCGVSPGAVSKWALAAGVETVHSERTRAALEARQLDAATRRDELATRLLLVAEIGLERELELIATADLRDVVGARTRAIHDAQLLAGQATSRTEHRSELDREIESLAVKMAATPADA